MYSLFKPPSPTSSFITATTSTAGKADLENLNTDAVLSEIYGDDCVMKKPFENLSSIKSISVTQHHNPLTTTDSLPSDQHFHTGETPYECQRCGKSFNKSSSLSKHLRIHTGVTPYECEHCGKKFKQSPHLKTHLRIHTGETPYECEHCGKKFKQSSHLKTHLRIHTGETPYECEHCADKFSRLCSLKKHLRIHTCETPDSKHSFQDGRQRKVKTNRTTDCLLPVS